MALSDVMSRCMTKWRDEGIDLAPPIPEDEIRRVWNEAKQPLSADVVQLYSTVGGFQDYVFSEGLHFSLWPWGWLIEQNSQFPRPGMKFCDHSIEIVTWEFRYESPEYSSVWSSDDSLTAPEMETFFERYLQDSWSIL